MAAPGRVPNSSTGALTVGGGMKGDRFYSEPVNSTLNRRVVIDEAAFAGDSAALAAQVTAYLKQTYPRTLLELEKTRRCINCKCDYTLALSLGRWECSRHYEKDGACCKPGAPGVTSHMLHNGCVKCDHQDAVQNDHYGYQIGVYAVPQYLLRCLRPWPHTIIEMSPAQLRLTAWIELVVDPVDSSGGTEVMFTVLAADWPLQR
jgi:hypothetical protein